MVHERHNNQEEYLNAEKRHRVRWRGGWLQRRDQRKIKAIVLTRTYERLHERQALHIGHDFAPSATYRASQQAAAKARAVAIGAVAAEQDTKRKGAGVCRLSYSAVSRVVPSAFRLAQGAVSRVRADVDMLVAQ